MLAAALFLFSGQLADIEGRWEGFLQYRDYQSGELTRIPMAVEGEMHGPVLIQKTSFADPGYKVLTVSTAVFDEEAGKLFETYSEEGNVERSEADAAFEVISEGWRLTANYDGFDDGRKAAIRIVTTLKGDTLRIEKTVNPDGDSDDTYAFRNEVVLKRQ